jgi:hypothetical protein
MRILSSLVFLSEVRDTWRNEHKSVRSNSDTDMELVVYYGFELFLKKWIDINSVYFQNWWIKCIAEINDKKKLHLSVKLSKL